MAERFEPGDQAAGFPFGVRALGEVAGAEFVVGRAVARMYQMMTIIVWATATMAFFFAAGLW